MVIPILQFFRNHQYKSVKEKFQPRGFLWSWEKQKCLLVLPGCLAVGHFSPCLLSSGWGSGSPWYLSSIKLPVLPMLNDVFVEGWAPLRELTFGRQIMAHRQSMPCTFDYISNWMRVFPFLIKLYDFSFKWK